MDRMLYLVAPLCLAVAGVGAVRAAPNDDLLAAAKSGNAQQVGQALEAGADPNARDDRGATPLFWAALSGSKPAAESLLARSADVNATDSNGFTPLHAAAYNLHSDVAELLLRKGAQVNAISSNGMTPLHKAMERQATLNMGTAHGPAPDRGQMNAIVALLLANGADVNAADAQAQGGPLLMAAAVGDGEILKQFLTKGARIDTAGADGVTALYAATKAKQTEAVKTLLAHGARIDPRTKSGSTPLIWAARAGDVDIARVLIAQGANVDARDVNGESPLIWTLWSAHSATPKAKMRWMRSAPNVAAREQIEADIARMPGHWREVAKLLIEHGAKSDPDPRGQAAPLYVAANLGYADIVQMLVDRGADLNEGGSGETALHAAIAEKHRDIVDLLVAKGADLNSRNMSGRTPLHFLARDIKDKALAELFIAHGADPGARDKNDDTPLVFAAISGNQDVLEVLRPYVLKKYIAGREDVQLSREAKFAQLLAKCSWPNLRQLATITRNDIPRAMLAAIGRREQLGDAWRAGNPNWEALYANITALVQAEETVNGSLVAPDPAWYASLLSATSIDDDEIVFLTLLADTELGKAANALLDIVWTGVAAESVRAGDRVTDEGKAELAALASVVKDRFLGAAKRIAELEKGSRVEGVLFGTAMRKVEVIQTSVDRAARELGQERGLRFAQRVVFELANATASQVAAFRADQAAKGAGAGVPSASTREPGT